MSEPVSIKDIFTKMVEEMAGAGAGATSAEEVSAEVDQRVAERYGVPFDELVYAVLGEQDVCLRLLFSAGPERAFATAQIAAFLAGVRWEQGRHAEGYVG